ncbi:MAG: hypothetical protein IJZ65_05465 [Ruminiclostridium sp.]|nr:hypothetical protein [Ruminiclostridium sp.]
MLEQISVFIENKKGRLASVMEILNNNKIDIRALTIADTTDFGIIRIVVKDAKTTLSILKENDCTATVTKVIGFTISDASGSLYEVIGAFEEAGINVEYCYSLMCKRAGEADIVVRVDDKDKAVEVLEKMNIKLLSADDIA